MLNLYLRFINLSNDSKDVALINNEKVFAINFDVCAPILWYENFVFFLYGEFDVITVFIFTN